VKSLTGCKWVRNYRARRSLLLLAMPRWECGTPGWDENEDGIIEKSEATKDYFSQNMANAQALEVVMECLE
jgi:hypothetical protein